MEHDVVLANKVDKACIVALPPLFPVVGQQFLGVADVANRRVEPHIEHFAISPLNRHRNAPFKVTAHGAWFQPHVKPALTLSHHIAAPLLVLLRNPRLEPLLVLVERQVPVFGFAQHRFRPAHGRARVNQFGRRERRATLFALVTISPLSVAVRTFARNVSVGQEGVRLLVVVLFALLLHKLSLVVEFAEKVRSRLFVHLRGGASEHVERDAEALKRLAYNLVVAVNHLLRCAALLAGAYGDGHAMLVATADKQYVTFLQAQVAHINVGRHIHPGQVADVHTAISVWQGGGNQRTVKFLFHYILLYYICV